MPAISCSSTRRARASSRIAGKDKEKSVLRRRSGRARLLRVHHAVPVEVRPLELAQVSLRRKLRHAALGVSSTCSRPSDDTDFNGVILLSQILNFDDQRRRRRRQSRASICPTSWRCRPMPRRRGTTTSCPDQPVDLEALLGEVEQFAMSDYARRCGAGSTLSADQRDAIAAKLHDYTGLPVELHPEGRPAHRRRRVRARPCRTTPT